MSNEYGEYDPIMEKLASDEPIDFKTTAQAHSAHAQSQTNQEPFRGVYSDQIRCLSLILSFVMLVLWDRKVWLLADFFAAFGFGVALTLFPYSMVAFQVEGILDENHLHLIRCVGVTMICSSFMYIFTKETRDGTVPITLMMSRVFSCSLLLCAMCYGHWLAPHKKGLKFHEQHIFFGMLGVGLWLLGNLIHLWKSLDFNTYPQHNTHINAFLRVDGLLVMTTSLCFFAFPDYAFYVFTDGLRGDRVHLHLMRVVGVQSLGSAVVSMQAAGFLHEHDKNCQFTSRLLTYLLSFSLIGIEVLVGKLSNKAALKALMMAAPVIINACVGICSGGWLFYKPKENSKELTAGEGTSNSSKSKND